MDGAADFRIARNIDEYRRAFRQMRLVVEFAVGDHTLETVPLFDEFAAN
jgi:hypothetical protein